MILVTNIPSITRHETPAKAARQAHRWLRYVRRADGRVERMQ